MSVCCECCVLSGGGLCDGLITGPEESYGCGASFCVIYEGRTESHKQLFFLHANWKQQTKESAVVDGTSCCVILECLVTSIACIT